MYIAYMSMNEWNEMELNVYSYTIHGNYNKTRKIFFRNRTKNGKLIIV